MIDHQSNWTGEIAGWFYSYEGVYIVKNFVVFWEKKSIKEILVKKSNEIFPSTIEKTYNNKYLSWSVAIK